jgi:hypothetical protein
MLKASRLADHKHMLEVDLLGMRRWSDRRAGRLILSRSDEAANSQSERKLNAGDLE